MQNTTIQPNDMPGRQKTGAPQAHLSSKAHVHALHASACRHSHCCRLAPPPRVCQARGGGMRTAGAAMYTAVAYHPIISYGTVQTDMHSSRRGCRYTGGQAAAKSPAVGCLPCLAITRLIRTCRATACAKPVCTHTHARASAHTACPSNLNAHPPSAARDTQQPHTQRCKRLCVCVHRTSTKECAQALAPHASPRAPPHPPTTALELWLCVGNGGAQHHSVAGDAQQDCQLAPRSTLLHAEVVCECTQPLDSKRCSTRSLAGSPRSANRPRRTECRSCTAAHAICVQCTQLGGTAVLRQHHSSAA
jgi:hypothetical protein